MARNTHWTTEDLKNKGIKTDGTRFSKEDLAPKKRVKKEFPNMMLPETSLYGIFIPGNVPSSKNHRMNSVRMDANDKIIRKENGKIDSISVGSHLVSEYKKKTKEHWEVMKGIWLHMVEGLQLPLKIEFLFVRDSNRKADFHNLVQLPLDLMQEYGWIKDDDMNTVFPYPPDGPMKYGIDPGKPGVYIRIKS